MDRLGHKLCAMATIFVTIFIATALPIKVSAWFEKKGEKGRAILSAIMCFGGGVFLGTYLLHMTPEVEDLISKTITDPQNITYPIAQLIIGAGFFFMMYLERATTELQKWKVRRARVAEAASGGKVGPLELPGGSAGGQVATISLQNLGGKGSSTPAGELNTGFAADDVKAAQMGDGMEEDRTKELALSEAAQVHGEASAVAAASGGHSHMQGGAATGRSIFLLLALSIDSLFEGLSLGLQKKTSGVWRMVLAILSHELAVGFSLGLQLSQHNSPKRTLLMAFIYGSVCPVGIAIGTAVMEGANKDMNIDLVYGVLLGITAGVFLFVAFFGILLHEITQESRMVNLVAVLVGFSMMAGLLFIHNRLESE